MRSPVGSVRDGLGNGDEQAVTIRKTDAPRTGMAGIRAVFFVLGIMPGWLGKIRAATDNNSVERWYYAGP